MYFDVDRRRRRKMFERSNGMYQLMTAENRRKWFMIVRLNNNSSSRGNSAPPSTVGSYTRHGEGNRGVIRSAESSGSSYNRSSSADTRSTGTRSSSVDIRSTGAISKRPSSADIRSRSVETTGGRGSHAGPGNAQTRSHSTEMTRGAMSADDSYTDSSGVYWNGTSSASESARSSKNKLQYGLNKSVVSINDLTYNNSTITIRVNDAKNYNLPPNESQPIFKENLPAVKESPPRSDRQRNPPSRVVYDDTTEDNQVASLKKELQLAQLTIEALQEREKRMKSRLAEQAQKIFERGIKFENLSLGEQRPSSLIRFFAELFEQSRMDTLDALDELEPLKYTHQLKSKITFTVIVLAFRSVQNTLIDIKDGLRSLLQVPNSNAMDNGLSDLDNGVLMYLRRTTDSYDLTRNSNDVAAQIHATLYDYPCLKDCPALERFVNDCVYSAWCLSIQNPPFVIEYERRTFDENHHRRSHSSDFSSDAIKSYLWPELLEGENGRCVHKGIVLT